MIKGAFEVCLLVTSLSVSPVRPMDALQSDINQRRAEAEDKGTDGAVGAVPYKYSWYVKGGKKNVDFFIEQPHFLQLSGCFSFIRAH